MLNETSPVLTPLTAAEWRRRRLRGNPPKISRDDEVCQFVTEALASTMTMTFAGIVAACREKFGHDRAPSHTGLYRYWRTLLPRDTVIYEVDRLATQLRRLNRLARNLNSDPQRMALQMPRLIRLTTKVMVELRVQMGTQGQHGRYREIPPYR